MTTRRRLPREHLVERASALLRDRAAEGLRITELSRVAGVSERALRNAFRRQHGLSPKQFDIQQRLNDARLALREDDPSASVTAIATRFGFFELGRFAQMYKRAFGESPSETIRSRGRRPVPFRTRQ
jgi:AraC-like DNA-binding protein